MPVVTVTALAGLAVALSLAVAALPLPVAAVAVAAVTVVVLAFIEPTVALAALLASIPLSTVVTLDAGDFSVTAIEPLVALLLAAWLARGVARGEIRASAGQLAPLYGLVLLAVLASSLSAERPGLLFKETAKWIQVGLVLFFTAGEVADRGRQLAVIGTLLATGLGEAAFGIYQFTSGQGPSAFIFGEALRAFGHFDQPNPFAGYLATIVPLGVALLLMRPRRLPAAATGLCLAGMALGIWFSQSRGAWLGLLVGLGAMAATWSPRTRTWLGRSAVAATLVVLLTLANILPGGWSSRLTSIVDNLGVFDVRTVELTPENFAVVERMAHWQAGWYMLVDHPIFGVGAGNYPAVYDDYALPGWPESLGHAHNYYLNMAAETGLLGAAAFVSLFAVAFKLAFAGVRRTEERPQRALLVGTVGALGVVAVHSLFDNLFVHGVPVQIGFLLGLVVALNRPDAVPAGPA